MSDNEEGRMVAAMPFWTAHARSHIKNGEFAILLSPMHKAAPLKKVCKLAFRLSAAFTFYQRKGKSVAYLKLTSNPHDEESFKTHHQLSGAVSEKQPLKNWRCMLPIMKSLWTMADNIDMLQFNRHPQNQLLILLQWSKVFRPCWKKDAYEVASHIAKSTGILKELYNDQVWKGLSRYENIQNYSTQ